MRTTRALKHNQAFIIGMPLRRPDGTWNVALIKNPSNAVVPHSEARRRTRASAAPGLMGDRPRR